MHATATTVRPLPAIDAAVKLATVALLAIALARPDLPQFRDKAFAARAVIYPIALAVLPVAWALLGRRRTAFPVAADILIGLPFLVDMAGNALGLYDAIDWWDDANHLVNWAIHTAGVSLLLRATGLPAAARAGLGVAWAASTAILWELGEFVTFVPGSAEASTAYRDTLGDLGLGLLGGAVASVVVARWSTARPATAPPVIRADGVSRA